MSFRECVFSLSFFLFLEKRGGGVWNGRSNC